MSDIKKTAILFMSDLHFDDDKNEKEIKGRLEIDDENNYVHKFTDYVKEYLDKKEAELEALVILGDLVQEASPIQYAGVSSLLEILSNELKLKKQNIMLIPGNHDVNREKLKHHCQEGSIPFSEAYKYNDIKFTFFKGFYDSFFKDTQKIFNPQSLHVDTINIDKVNTIIIGLNSNKKESFRREDHIGYIDIKELRDEIINRVPKDKFYILALHHSIRTSTDTILPTIDKKLIRPLKEIFATNNTNLVVFGHVHEGENVSYAYDESNMISVGSFSKKLEEDKNNSVCFLIEGEKSTNYIEYDLTKIIYSGVDGWNETKPQLIKFYNQNYENKELERQNNTETLPIVIKENSNVIIETNDVDEDSNVHILCTDHDNKILKIVKEQKLLMSGHFHWKDGGKSHGMININRLINDASSLGEISKTLKKCFDILQLKGMEVDLVIGYGIEGNILGATLSDFFISKDIDYTYYPSVYKEHNCFEKKLHTKKNYKNIVVLTDVINKGQKVEKLLNNESDFFMDCSTINLIGIFHVTHSGKKEKMYMNHALSQINYYALTQFDIPSCTYEDSNDCLIYSKNYDEVIEF